MKSTPTFNLLSIGHRGVGKSVFLAGSYAELQSERKADRAPANNIWFEGADRQAHHTLEELLAYMARTGKYPSPTMRVTDFKFRVWARGFRQDKTLCEFCWADIPGEICHLGNTDFEAMLLKSHGCCVFIDAAALVQDPNYITQLEETFQQVEVVSSLASQSGLQYFFALILTKCDLLPEGPSKLLKIELKLRSLMARLDAANTVYRRFYSSIPIRSAGAASTVAAQGAAAPLLWLVSELRKKHRIQAPQTLESVFARTLSNQGIMRSPRSVFAQPRVFAALGAVGLVAAAWFGGTQLLSNTNPAQSQIAQGQKSDEIVAYEQTLAQDPKNETALRKLVTLHQQQEQYDPALDYLEQLIELQPKELELYFQKAGLYALLGQRKKEEAAYDEILAMQADHVTALTNKAILRSTQEDYETAKALFAQAEAATDDPEVKQTIRAVSKDWLEAGTN